ncbi:hypothetical protein Cgig2_000713 [Carnegiea gigantea]|uniref:Mitochondrial inner membrane protease subunit 2 n=1 Tax=Carnegiea gigantea TaxID=171969 RepID=A0A9Q1KC81_9CARY|nr:hypothetical protein Cgig2_000713 [Carnegiea gigantea]
MVSLSTWFRYVAHKFEYSLAASWKCYKGGKISQGEVGDVVWKNLLQGKMTFLHWIKGEEMAPTIGSQGGTLLVRKIPVPDPTRVFVGDVVVLKDPEKPDDLLVRRLAAVEGYEMVSKDEKEEPFVLEKDECWVLSDNEALKPKRLIKGPSIFASQLSMQKDSSVLEVELDVDEMTKNHKSS